MPNEDNKILKYNHGEKSMKASFIIHADLIHVKIILKNLTQKKKLCIRLLGIQCFNIVHLTQQKANLIAIGAKIVWKSFVKT